MGWPWRGVVCSRPCKGKREDTNVSIGNSDDDIQPAADCTFAKAQYGIFPLGLRQQRFRSTKDDTMTLSGFLAYSGALAIAAAIPGPQIVAIIAQAMKAATGRRCG